MIVGGLDGCRGGWVLATHEGARMVTSFREALLAVDVLGVDMPIGLPSSWYRHADREARALLRHRSSTVFSTPPRWLISAPTYEDASARSATHSGRGLSMQTFNLFGKIREVDDAISRGDEAGVAEIHPECSFSVMTGTLMPPKRTPEGVATRRAAVVAAFGVSPGGVRGARMDDVLDAYAVLWSADRFARGCHRTLGDGERDERGLLMRIVV